MLRLIARRLAFLPVALLLVNLAGFAYAHAVLPIRASRIPYLAARVSTEPLWPAYTAYLQEEVEGWKQHEAGGKRQEAVAHASLASLGLLGLALALGVPTGVILGMSAGASGGPTVASDGTVYVVSKSGTLYALDRDGEIVWQMKLSAGAVGTPALGPGGDIYVADAKAGLSAVRGDGTLRWRFQSAAGSLSTAGPTVAVSGTIVYPIGNALQAVSADGEAAWLTRVPSIYGNVPPSSEPTGGWLFWRTYVLDARDGAILELGLPVTASWYFVGADGRTYLVAGHDVMRWAQTETGARILDQTRWDYRSMGAAAGPTDAGVSRQGVVWLFYNNLYERTRIAWLTTGGRVLGAQRLPLPRAQMIGVDGMYTGYVCGLELSGTAAGPVCLAVEPKSEEPVWQVSLDQGERVVGGALRDGTLYVVMESPTGQEAWLYAIGDRETGDG